MRFFYKINLVLTTRCSTMNTLRSIARRLSVLTSQCENVRDIPLRCIHTSRPRFAYKLIDGKAIANEIQKELQEEVSEMTAGGFRPPQLSAIVVGNCAVSHLYVKKKMEVSEEVGIDSRAFFLPVSVTESELLQHICLLNEDSNVDGILVQLPLPKHIDERVVSNTIAPQKDVDGMNVVNIGRLCLNMDSLVPCTALGVRELIHRTGIETRGKHALICGRSKHVGMPIAMLLHADNRGHTDALDATTTICHRFTPRDQLTRLAQTADILISATGVPGLITSDMVKEGACVIDVGITRHKDKSSGRSILLGDVDFRGVSAKVDYITPVPGGVGPMTVVMLMKNTIRAAKKVVQYDDFTRNSLVSIEKNT